MPRVSDTSMPAGAAPTSSATPFASLTLLSGAATDGDKPQEEPESFAFGNPNTSPWKKDAPPPATSVRGWQGGEVMSPRISRDALS